MNLLKNLFVMLAVLFGMLAAEQMRAEDLFMGEYEGTFHADRSQKTRATAKVIAEGPGYYRVVLQAEPLVPGEPTAPFEIYGVQQGTSVNLFGRANSAHWHGRIADERLVADPGYYHMGIDLKKTTRKSPTEGLQPPGNAVVLLPFTPGKAPFRSCRTPFQWCPKTVRHQPGTLSDMNRNGVRQKSECCPTEIGISVRQPPEYAPDSQAQHQHLHAQVKKRAWRRGAGPASNCVLLSTIGRDQLNDLHLCLSRSGSG